MPTTLEGVLLDDGHEARGWTDVPQTFDILPDGHEAIVIGDVVADRALWHPQGENSFGFKGTCGLVACEEMLREVGVEVTEDTVVEHAIDHGQCSVTLSPLTSGGTTAQSQVALLGDFGVPAHIERLGSLEEVAQALEHGHAVIAEVNVGRLWNDVRQYDFGHANHTVAITGVARDPANGRILGMFVNDTGRGVPGDAGRFVAAGRMEASLIDAGGECVISDGERSFGTTEAARSDELGAPDHE
jgi:hypothetical protein